MAGNEVRIKATATGNAKQEIKGLRDAWRAFQREGNEGVKAGLTAAAATKGFSILDSAIHGVLDTVGNWNEAQSNLEQSEGAIEAVFGPAADTIEDFGKTADASFGLSERAVNELAATTGAQLKSFGFSAEEAAGQTLKLQKRAADLAATFGGPTEDAVRAISALMRGERDPIERYGVSLKDADIQARVMSKGLDTSTVAAKKNSEAIAALELFYEQTADAAGQFGREQNTAAGQSARLTAEIENMNAELGEETLPLQLKITQAQRAAIPVITDVVQGVMDAADGWGIFADKMTTALDVITFWDEQTHGLPVTARHVADEWNNAAASMSHMADAAKDDVRDTADAAYGLQYATERVGDSAEEAAKKYDDAMDEITNSFRDALSDMAGAADQAASSIYDPLIDQAKLAELERTAAELRTERNMADAHSRERDDAQAKLTEIEKETMETLGRLAEAGDKEAAARLKAMAAAALASGRLSDAQIADLNQLLVKIAQAEAAARRLASLKFMSGASKDDTYIPGRASGGEVKKGHPYWVGENRKPELFIPESDGRIVANPAPMGYGSPAASAPVIVNVYPTGVMTPAAAQALRDELAPVLSPIFERRR